MKLSPEARVSLRKAITNHSAWDQYRKSNNLSLATMSRDNYFEAAQFLGIDVAEIIRVANNGEKIKSDNSGKAQAAASAFNDDAPKVKANGFDDDTQAVFERNKRDHEDTARREQMRRSEEYAREAHKAVSNDDKASKLFGLIAEIAGNSINADEVRAIVREELEASGGNGGNITIKLQATDGTIKNVKGHHHPQFAKLLKAATARDVSGYVVNMWIAGPAGSGKTHAVKAIAKALDTPFHLNGAIGMSHELLGFVDGAGYYHRTAFREAYEHGGCYLFDEVDGSDNSALLALNAALANGQATFPDGVIERHKDCRIFCAANTWGFGGTADYVGRSKIDAAFLSRFPVKFHWSYDNTLELNICGNQEFAARVQRARQAAFNAGLKVLITPRDSIAGAALIATGFTHDEAAEMTYLGSLTAEQRRMIERD